jgi:hypothetical protein
MWLKRSLIQVVEISGFGIKHKVCCWHSIWTDSWNKTKTFLAPVVSTIWKTTVTSLFKIKHFSSKSVIFLMCLLIVEPMKSFIWIDYSVYSTPESWPHHDPHLRPFSALRFNSSCPKTKDQEVKWAKLRLYPQKIYHECTSFSESLGSSYKEHLSSPLYLSMA